MSWTILANIHVYTPANTQQQHKWKLKNSKCLWAGLPRGMQRKERKQLWLRTTRGVEWGRVQVESFLCYGSFLFRKNRWRRLRCGCWRAICSIAGSWCSADTRWAIPIIKRIRSKRSNRARNKCRNVLEVRGSKLTCCSGGQPIWRIVAKRR